VALRILQNARRNLAVGFTTVRDLGGWNHVEFSVRDAIQRSDFCGPRLVLAGRCITGSDAAAAQYAGRYRLARGTEEVRKAAREQIRAGADVLELGMTGSMLVQGDIPVAKHLGLEEIGAAVDEATKADKQVAAHAHGIDGIRQAVLAGVHSIEHGTFLHKGRDVIEEMKARGIDARLNDVLSMVLERDRIDSTRDVAPLRVAPDAVLIDSEQLTAEQTFEQVKQLCE